MDSREVSPTLDIKVVAENDAAPAKKERFEVVPCWDRNTIFVEPIISNTKDVDIVHIQHEYGIYSFDDRLPVLLERLNETAKRTIVTLHCVRPGQFSVSGDIDEKFTQRIAALAGDVIVHLESQKAILERLRIPSTKIHIIPHGTAVSNAEKKVSRLRLNLPEEGKIITVFGFVNPFKDLDVSIEVFKEIRAEVEEVYLFIAGGLPPDATRKAKDYVESIRKRIEELNLTDMVIFPNMFFANEAIPYIFGASDIALFTHYHEDRSVSGSIHLAIGAKKPVIAYRIPKFEVVKHISDELLILPDNASGIAKTAIRIFTDNEFEQYVLDRTDGYRNATSWPVTVHKHLKLYSGAG